MVMANFPSIFNSHAISMFDHLEDELFNFKVDYPYNLYEKEDGTNVIELALAGFSKEDISVKIENDHLKINVKKEKDKEKKYLHRGIATRNLKTSFTLGSRVDKKNIKSSYENGMLQVEIPIINEETTIDIM